MVHLESVRKLAEAALEKHPADMLAAIQEAEKNVRALPEFEELVAALVRDAVKELVYDVRHKDNTRRDQEEGLYASEPAASPAPTGKGKKPGAEPTAEKKPKGSKKGG